MFFLVNQGLSNRLTGGASNVNCLSGSQQAGEGWSDLCALFFTATPTDTGTMSRGVGNYVLSEPTTGTGIRPAPYTTDINANPYTYGDISSQPVPHGVGFVWASIVWEVYWALVDEYGFDEDLYAGTGGNNIAIQLVVDGLKIQPCNPTFVEARDAILEADEINNRGVNKCLIWEGFAKRGLGVNAYDGGSPYSRSVQEDFQLPQACLGPTAAPTASPKVCCVEDFNSCILASSESDCEDANGIFIPAVGSCSSTVAFPSGSVSLPIPDSGGGFVSHTITVQAPYSVTNVKIRVKVTHTWVGDLDVHVSHGGTSIKIYDISCSGNNFDTVLDDEATAYPPCTSDLVSPPNYLPLNSLNAAFSGMDATGDWTIRVEDRAGADIGTLDEWEVILDAAENPCERYMPSFAPSFMPTTAPSVAPSESTRPSSLPSAGPSLRPSLSPSFVPSLPPSASPTASPYPSAPPSSSPSLSAAPSGAPSAFPSISPSAVPSASPSVPPSFAPSDTPSSNPSESPSQAPSVAPSASPSNRPSVEPSTKPSSSPSDAPSTLPTDSDIVPDYIEREIDAACPCDRQDPEPWSNHGDYVGCLNDIARRLVDEGVVSGQQMGRIVSERAQQSCGKRNNREKNMRGFFGPW